MLAGLISGTGPGTNPGRGREIMSSESRHVRYKINILGNQLSPSSINLVPVEAGKVTVGLASHWP